MAVGFKTGGRRPGTLNKATAEIKEVAKQYAPAALEELARLSTAAESEQARVAAIKEILDRAYGKAAQDITVDSVTEFKWIGPPPMSAIEWEEKFSPDDSQLN